MNKRAISSIMAIIILLSITVSSAGSAFFWLNRIQTQVASEMERFDVVSFEVPGAEVGILATDFKPIENELTMFLKNTGEETVSIKSIPETPTTAWLLKDIDNKVICASDWSGNEGAPICEQGCNQDLAPGELRKIILGNLDGMCNVAVKPEDSVFLYEIDFSGITKAEGSFVK